MNHKKQIEKLTLRPRDLKLEFQFTDRGGRNVYHIKQQRLAAAPTSIVFDKIGEVRVGEEDTEMVWHRMPG